MTLISKKIMLVVLAMMSMAMSQPLQAKSIIGESLEGLSWLSTSIMLVAVTALIMFVILIIQLFKMRQARIMAMIDKGIYQPKPIDWKLLLLLAGIILLATTPGVVLLVIVYEGLYTGIGVGLIMLFGGVGMLVFRHLAREYLPSPSEKKNQ